MNYDLQGFRPAELAQYRCLYNYSKKWTGKESLKRKRVIVYCEGGFGDVIQFARYFKCLREQGCYLIVHCQAVLHRLLNELADEFIDRNQQTIQALPKHDYHVLSMSLPFLLNKRDKEFPAEPYLHVDEKVDLEEYQDDFKIGIAWEGNPSHSNNEERSCPLEYFTDLALPGNTLFMVQNKIHNQELIEGCENLKLLSIPLTDFWETATLINSLDVIITVDTVVAHLAGALNKKTYCLLSSTHDYRWNVANWYPSVKLIKQKVAGEWDSVFAELCQELGIKGKSRAAKPCSPILITGGIGDFITLECYLSKIKESLTTVYYATRASKGIIELFNALADSYPALREHIILWDDFSEVFCFVRKSECTKALEGFLPNNWSSVSDWSIDSKFKEIDAGYHHCETSSLLNAKLADISNFDLPSKYLVIVPESENDLRMKYRHISEDEWASILSYLHSNNLQGVLVNDSAINGPQRLINLTGETSLCESIEILKNASGYIGIDSCLSVLAAKLFNEHLFVKSQHSHLMRWKHIYYAPKKEFDFIVQDFTSVSNKP